MIFVAVCINKVIVTKKHLNYQVSIMKLYYDIN